MRFLKRKIALACAARSNNVCSQLLSVKVDHQGQRVDIPTPVLEPSAPNRIQRNTFKTSRLPKEVTGIIKPENYRATKNIVKNYAQAICKFALSSMATDYLTKIVKKEGVSLTGFLNHVEQIKPQIGSLYYFRSALLANPTDDKQIGCYKKVLREISEVFIKFFSVNWIFHSRLIHKGAYLKYRFKMLRRVRNPEVFTYLKN